jgi:UDP-N-acetyl-2-amino-2-deoxyglucuronate dehydrogenase
MARIKVAVIGLGMAVTPHARSLQDLAEEAEVVAACSPTEARRKSFAQRFPFPVTGDLDAAIAGPGVDAVLVLTPANTHRDIVLRAAAAGKHVLLEKPLEITTARALELVEACERAGVRLGTVLQHRFRPAGLRLRALMEEGRLGAIVGASCHVPWWRPQSYYDEPGRGTRWRDGGGVLITQAIHPLDLFQSLAGRVDEVQAYAQTSPVHRTEVEDMVAAAIRFENGALGTIDATTAAAPGFSERMTFIGEQGTATLAGTELSVHFADGEAEHLRADESAGGSGADPMDFPHDYHRSVIADFLAAIREGRDPAISGREALKVHRLIDALLESAERHGPVKVVRD